MAGTRETHVTQNPVAGQNILAVFPGGEDRSALERILGQAEWQVRFAGNLEEAQAVLRGCAIAVVLSEGCLPGGHTWKDLLAELQSMPIGRPLIVADRMADDRLWAEVLNLGGYDLLMKPFNAREVLRTVRLACGWPPDLQEPAAARPEASESGAQAYSNHAGT